MGIFEPDKKLTQACRELVTPAAPEDVEAVFAKSLERRRDPIPERTMLMRAERLELLDMGLIVAKGASDIIRQYYEKHLKSGIVMHPIS